jgi:peroxiredoxin Q/BCP
VLKSGDVAPDFELQTDAGELLKMSDLRGKKVILYFYPKDNTPGCTTEAVGFRDHTREIEREGAVILGVSPDSVKSHQKFKTKYELPFTLLSDPDHAVADAYGAWGEKQLYGKTFIGVLRTTFIVDEEGVIQDVFLKVRPKGHAEQILQILGG